MFYLTKKLELLQRLSVAANLFGLLLRVLVCPRGQFSVIENFILYSGFSCRRVNVASQPDIAAGAMSDLLKVLSARRSSRGFMRIKQNGNYLRANYLSVLFLVQAARKC